jgi:LmbE family N-acetylglucosaminyl deacetylase
LSLAKHSERRERTGLPLAMRLHKAWHIRKSGVMRNLAVILRDLSDTCLRHAELSSDSGKATKKAPVRAQLGWRSLLLQLGTQRSIAAILDAGVLGNDMSREARLPPGNRLLVLAAHQDDETIGAAGTFLQCAKAGYEFQVVYYTDGATAFADLDPSETTRLRRDEARRVWHRIAGIEPIFWDYPNRAPAVAPEAGECLARLIKEFRPSAIFVPVFLEQVLEHKRMSEVLLLANEAAPLPESLEVWGYQITTRAPGNVVVDITKVSRQKYAINQLWSSQNYYVDYAHLAKGRDILNSYYLKFNKIRQTAAQAETFLVFDAPTYVQLAQEFLDLPARPGILARTEADACPPPNFFVIGMQKSGTYWLTALLDLHPQIRCFPSRPGHEDGSGEAHLFDHLANMDTDYARFSRSFQRKLDGHFAGVVPKKAPESAHARDAMLDDIRVRFNQYCHLQRLRFGKPVVGEKTAETVHHLDLLERLYPGARKICILRDPRDRVVSFHYHQVRKGRLAPADSLSAEHVESYLARVRQDYEGLLAAEPPIHVLTYEGLIADSTAEAERLLRFLAVEPDAAAVEAMVAGASFERLASRSAGEEDGGSHFRKGVVGDWRSLLQPDLGQKLVDELAGLTGRVEQMFGLDLARYRQP